MSGFLTNEAELCFNSRRDSPSDGMRPVFTHAHVPESTNKMEEQDEDVKLPIASVFPRVGGDKVLLNGMLLHCRAKTQQCHTQSFTNTGQAPGGERKCCVNRAGQRDVRRWNKTAQKRQNFSTALPTTRTQPPQGKPDLSLKRKNFQNSHLAISSSTYVQNKHRLQIRFLSVTFRSKALV